MTSSTAPRTRQGAPHSMWLRSRWWSTVACVLAFGGGLWAAWGHHTLHALLLLAASMLLARGSIWGRRARRRRVLALAEARAQSVLNSELGEQAGHSEVDPHPATRPGWREVA